MAELIGIGLLLLGPVIIMVFTKEPEAIAYGWRKMQICAPFYFALAASHGFSDVLRGAGKAKVPMLVMIGAWCVFRVAFIAVLVPVYQSIDVVNWVYPVTWSISTVILLIYYLKADWLHALD